MSRGCDAAVLPHGRHTNREAVAGEPRQKRPDALRIVVEEEVEDDPHPHQEPLHISAHLAGILDLCRYGLHPLIVSVQPRFQFPATIRIVQDEPQTCQGQNETPEGRMLSNVQHLDFHNATAVVSGSGLHLLSRSKVEIPSSLS